MPISILVSAVVAAIVGFGGTLAIVVAAARAVGADPAQTTSWVTALCLAMAATSSWLSWHHRQPIITAWSTPGAALIAATGGTIALPAAIAAFLLAGALVVLTAAFRPVGTLIQRLPAAVAAAMLAGVLLRFVVAPFESIHSAPELVLPLLSLFLVVRLISPTAAVLIVLMGGVLLAWAMGLVGPLPNVVRLSSLLPMTPVFEPAVLIGLGLPLYLVTMASQNLPGFAVLAAAGYEPPSRSILAVTGLASLVTAPFGAHASNLAAITAAICTGPDTHPDPARRWLAGPLYGLCYLILAMFGASLVQLFAALPPALITTVAGVALIGPFAAALASALADQVQRFAAVLTLVVTASGVSVLGIGAPFWGLVAGLLAIGFDRIAARYRSHVGATGLSVAQGSARPENR